MPSSIANSSNSLQFWYFIEKTNKDAEVTHIANIKYDLFIQFLINNGFSLIDNISDYKFIHINEFNQIEIVSDLYIRQFVIDFITQNNNLNKKESSCLLDHLYRNSNQLFGNNIKNLPISNQDIKSKLIKDKNKIVYLFYENGFRKITKDDTEFYEYSNLNGLIWKNSILKRNYKRSDNRVSEIERFFKLVCTNRDNEDSLNFNESKYNTLKSAVGYLLSREKIMSETVGVVLCDEAISDNPQGGSGKSIAALSLSKMRNVTTIDGRYVKADSQFKFETIDESTEIINFDDCGAKFDFQNFFSVITLDCTIEKKKVSRYTIPFEDSPKMIFSTNHIFQGAGTSHERRVFEIEFSNYFDTLNTPIKEFGHDLFDGWDSEEWNRFDDFMTECIRFYLENGLIRYKQLNTGYKKLIENTGTAIAQYCDNYIEFDKVYRAEVVTEELNNIMKTTYGQAKITKSVHYWAETYKKLYFYQEFNKNLKTTIYVISTDKNKELSYFKKQDQFKNLSNTENRIITPRTNTDSSSYDDLFSM